MNTSQKTITVGDKAPDPVTPLADHQEFPTHPKILEQQHER